jgi:hypothetical protein
LSRSVQCPYCRRPAKLVDAAEVYGRNWAKGGKLWLCRPCEAWVGCHRGSATHKPLGRLANAELRRWKQKAHDLFDRLWRDGAMSRKEAYAWMAGAMGIPVGKAHIGMFGVDQCRELIRLLERSPA